MLFLILVLFVGYMLNDMLHWEERELVIAEAYDAGYLEGMKDLASVLEELEKKA